MSDFEMMSTMRARDIFLSTTKLKTKHLYQQPPDKTQQGECIRLDLLDLMPL